MKIHSIKARLCCLAAMSLLIGHFFIWRYGNAAETSSKVQYLDLNDPSFWASANAGQQDSIMPQQYIRQLQGQY